LRESSGNPQAGPPGFELHDCYFPQLRGA
jgi:hypothetical protein